MLHDGNGVLDENMLPAAVTGGHVNRTYDVLVIGAGILGLATAMKLVSQSPAMRVAVLEKEDRIAAHQTGHNSGVIHSGIYYRPGSLKARMCLAGAQQLIEFCREQQVPHELCGKLVIATQPHEIPKLHELHRRGIANGVPGLQLVPPHAVRSFEPRAQALLGMHVPATGIVDFRQVAQAYASVFQARGGDLLLRRRVRTIHGEAGQIAVQTDGGRFYGRSLLNCAGLHADHVARLAGIDSPCRIVPFRGEYYRIRPERDHLVKHLIYPVPDPRFPFLGVHFTRMMDGRVEAGPNAVLAWAREGYAWTTVDWPELLETFSYRGFWHLTQRYWQRGWQEMVRSLSKSRFTQALQRLIPEITAEDLHAGGAGVRAQALGRDGSLLDDFLILRKERMLHVLNAPSPAATSSLAIADYIIDGMPRG